MGDTSPKNKTLNAVWTVLCHGQSSTRIPMKNIEEVKRQTNEDYVSVDDAVMLWSDDSVTRCSDDDVAADPDDTMTLEVLKLHSWNPFSALSTAGSYTVPILIFLMLLVGSIRYFGYSVDSVDSVEKLQRKESNALRNELKSQQYMLDELRQIVRQQARSQRSIAAASPLATDEFVTNAVPVGENDAVPKSAQALQRPARAPLPASLEPGQVLLIVASTPIKEEALDLAQTLEFDSHASEVVLGLTGFYGVALGRFEFEQAESIKMSMVESAPEKSAPYLMPDALIDSFIYP